MFLKASKFFLYASVFCVVIVMTTTFFPFIGGKYYFFRSMIELSLVSLLLWWAFEAQAGELERRFARMSSKPIFIAVSVFALAFLLACLFADDSHAAFWSNFERGEGGFQMIHYYLFFALSTLVFEKREEWMRMFQVSLVAGVMMVMYGVLATMGVQGFIAPSGRPDGNIFQKLFSGSRFQGSLGNPAYVAPYLLFSMFYGLYLLVVQKRSLIVAKAGYGFLVLFSFTFLVLSGTRGGFLGLVAGIIVFLLYLALSDKRFRKVTAIGFCILLVIGGILFSFRQQLVNYDVPGSRFLTISFTEQTAQTRFWTWNSAWQGFKDRPLFGWGPENFSTVFDKYFDPRHYVPGQNTETWFDRSHSVVFDYLAETGLIGFLAYIGMLGIFLYELFKRSFLRTDNQSQSAVAGHTWKGVGESAVLQGLCLSLIVAYFIQGLILFDVLPIYINLFLFLGFMTFEFSQTHAER